MQEPLCVNAHQGKASRKCRLGLLPCLQAHSSRVNKILLDYQKKLQERTEHHMG